MRYISRLALGFCAAALSHLLAAPDVHAQSKEDSNGCIRTQDNPCVRTGRCEIQGAVWGQQVTIDRADTFDTMGWSGLCDMVHVALVQGQCSPPGANQNVTVTLSATSHAVIDSISGPLRCAGTATAARESATRTAKDSSAPRSPRRP